MSYVSIWLFNLLCTNQIIDRRGRLLCYKNKEESDMQSMKSTLYANPKDFVTHTDQHIIFENGN